MGFFGKMLGFGKAPKSSTPTEVKPLVPGQTIIDGGDTNSAKQAAKKLRRRRGFASTFLDENSGLGSGGKTTLG